LFATAKSTNISHVTSFTVEADIERERERERERVVLTRAGDETAEVSAAW